MIRKNILIALFFFVHQTNAQELNAKVNVVYSQIGSTVDKKFSKRSNHPFKIFSISENGLPIISKETNELIAIFF